MLLAARLPHPDWAVPLAVATTLGPLALGAATGLGWRVRRGPARGRRAAAAAVGFVGLVVALDLVLLRPLGDVLWAAGWAAVAAALAATLSPGRLALVAGGSLVAVGAAEGLGRVVLPEPPTLAPVVVHPLHRLGGATPTGLGAGWYDELDACDVAYLEGRIGERLHRGLATGPAVLHLGDSVVHGTNVVPDATFVARLDGPDLAHLNGGVPGVSVDVPALAVRHLRDDALPAQLVLYVTPGNDVAGLDYPYVCCPGGGLLDDDLTARCPTPRTPTRWQALGARSPPPLALRVAADASPVAAHLTARLAGLRGGWGRPSDPAATRARLVAVVADAARRGRARGIPTSVVLLPDRIAHARPDVATSGRLDHHAIRAGLIEAGIPVHDAFAWMDGHADRLRDWFVDPIHLSEAGHAALAAWLGPRLADVREGAP